MGRNGDTTMRTAESPDKGGESTGAKECGVENPLVEQ